MKNLKLKLLALLIVTVLISPMLFACGEGADDSGGTPAATVADEGATEPTAEPTTPAPTEPPTTPAPTEPPTTTEPFVPDESMAYWDQIEAELAHHGLTGGIKAFLGDNEEELMRRLSPNNARRTDLDLSGESVPFSFGWSYETTRDVENFWDANFSINLARDLPTEQDDLIVGVVWIRGKRLAESERYFPDDDPIYYLAMKTPTDNWATEGEATPRGEQSAQEEWQKVFFYARVMNEETQASNVAFQFFIGYGFQQFDVGGLIAYKFPGNRDNERAAMNLVE